MALDVEGVLDGGVDRQEALRWRCHIRCAKPQHKVTKLMRQSHS